MMRAVFSYAALVMLWLGAARDGSDSAMDYLGASKQDVPHRVEGRWLDGALQGEIGERVVALLSRDSWNRIGIVNEVLLAQRLAVLCGRKRIAWSKLESLFGLAERHLARSWADDHRIWIRVVATQAYRLVLARAYLHMAGEDPMAEGLRYTGLGSIFCLTGDEIELEDQRAVLEVYNDLAAYFMGRILDELKVLTEQSSTVRLRVCDSMGRSVDNTDDEVARFEWILQRIDTLEADFDRIAQIRDIVRRLRSRAEEMEEGLDVGTAQ